MPFPSRLWRFRGTSSRVGDRVAWIMPEDSIFNDLGDSAVRGAKPRARRCSISYRQRTKWQKSATIPPSDIAKLRGLPGVLPLLPAAPLRHHISRRWLEVEAPPRSGKSRINLDFRLRTFEMALAYEHEHGWPEPVNTWSLSATAQDF